MGYFGGWVDLAGQRLVEVLPNLEGPTIDAWLVYPEELRHSRRIAVVRDFLIEQVEADARTPPPGMRLESVRAS